MMNFLASTLFLLLFSTLLSEAIGDNSIYQAGMEKFQDVGPFKVLAEIDPEVPKVGKNRLTVWVRDKAGRAVSGADLEVVAVMPAMGSMPAMYAPAEMTEIDTGRYEGEFEPAMSGEWPLTIEISASLGKGSITFDLATGRRGLRCSTCNHVGEEVPGTVRVDPTRRQLIGVKTGYVRQENLQVVIRALGVVTYDETRLRDIALKFNGWVGQLHADAIGKVVKEGEPLFTVYSPELLAAQEEYLEILRRDSRAKASDQQHRIEAARRRLRLWDLRDTQIHELEKRGTALEYVPILSPVNGVVIDKQIVAGSAFRMRQQLLRIADVSRVWVEAQVYDFELPLIKAGMKAEVILPDLQDREFEARVDYVYPFMEGDTHTAKVRVVLENADGLLRPAMYAEVRLTAQLGQRLLVPESAVLYSGRNRVVFLVVGDGRYAPRKIKTGQRNRQWIEVLEGLAEDDMVVTSGTFLIAAESKLKAGLDQW